MQNVSVFLAQHYLMTLAISGILIILMGIELLRLKKRRFRLSPSQVTQFINKDQAVVIDIRSNAAYRQGHIIHAASISNHELQTQPKKLDKYKTRPIIIVCENGVESQKIADRLTQSGYQCYSLAGGLRSWLDANMPLIKE